MTFSNNTQELGPQVASTDTSESIKHFIKQATAPYHQQVETHLSNILFNELLPIKCYFSVILAMHHSYRAMEIALNNFSLTQGLLVSRSKLAWLESDIAYLKTCCHDIELAENKHRPLTITSDAQAMGVLYVMEGATLGGGFIQRRLLAHPWLSKEQGIQFFSNYGKQRMAKWQEFLELLQHFYQQNPSTKVEINHGAAMAFNYIYQSIEQITP